MDFEARVNTIFLSAQKNWQYYFVVIVFLSAVFYHYFIVSSDVSKNTESDEMTIVAMEKPDLNSEAVEKVYSGVLHSRKGDVFRVGAFVKTEDTEIVEILARSPFNEIVQIGTWQLSASENGEYKELIFTVDRWYDDVILRLKNADNKEGSSDWNDPAVYVSSFSATRIPTGSETYVQSLRPTIFGSSIQRKELLSSQPVDAGSIDLPEWIFKSNGDVLRAVEFLGNFLGSRRQEYVFQLSLIGDAEKRSKIFQGIPFTPDALDDSRLESGNYRVSFFYPLKKDQQYVLSLLKKTTGDDDSSFKIGHLGTEKDVSQSVKNSDLVLHLDVHSSGTGNNIAPIGAKIEDLGKNLFYSFSLQKKLSDYVAVFEMSDGVKFDVEDGLVLGPQKKDTFFSYKFDTIYPYQRFAIEAEQEGDKEREIKLEYSFDNTFWREILFSQKENESQKFSTVLEGSNNEHIVYIRTSYNGEGKKSGSFALKSLRINALLLKP